MIHFLPPEVTSPSQHHACPSSQWAGLVAAWAVPLFAVGIVLLILVPSTPAVEPKALPEDYFWGACGLRATFAPAGRLLAISGEFHLNGVPAGVMFWDLDTGRKRVILDDKDQILVYSLAFSPDSKTFATGHREGAVRLWETASCKKVADLGEHDGRVLSAAFSPDGQLLATAAQDRKVFLWDIRKRRKHSTLSIHGGVVNAVAFSPDGKTLASAANDSTIRLTDVATGKQVGIINAPQPNNFWVVAFSPDGKTLASDDSTEDPQVMLCDARALQRKAVIPGHPGSLTSVAFSSDGRLLASGCCNGTVKVWDLRTGKECFTLSRQGNIQSLSFSPDSGILAGASRDSIKLWDSTTGKEVGVKDE